MSTSRKWPIALACVTLSVVVAPSAARAQDAVSRAQAISANPFGLLLEYFNAEYEHAVSESSTLGLGGSFISLDDDEYGNLDAFWRLYPDANPMDGWAFGAKAGFTHVDDGTYLGAGFDVNRSWLLGKNQNFYVGIGVGLKRLFGAGDDEEFDARFIPTVRLANVGFAFD